VPELACLVRLAASQVRLGLCLSAAWGPPGLGRAVRSVRGAPRVEEATVGGVAVTVYSPARGNGPWPAVVAFPGVTRRGRHHPAFVGLGRGLSSIGHLVVVAEPEGLARGELTAASVRDALAVTTGALRRTDVARGRVTLAGVSGGATLALRVAAAPETRARVLVVLALAPVCDLLEAVRFATTGQLRAGGRFVTYETRDFFRLVCARSVVAALPAGGSREQLIAHLRSLPDYGSDPLGALRTWPSRELDEGASAVLELLANEDPAQFDSLVGNLPEQARASLDALSVVAGGRDIVAPTELVVARTDKYVPLQDVSAFLATCPRARLTVLDSLEHVVPRLAVREVRDLVRLDAALVRTLAASYSR
jgi:pimeloyl-ACP methyl ester carboxylesterase